MNTYLVHAGLIESHNWGMGEPVEHSAQGFFGVKLLRLEKLFQELFVEHGGDDVIHNYSGKPKQKKKVHKELTEVRLMDFSTLQAQKQGSILDRPKTLHPQPIPTTPKKQQLGKRLLYLVQLEGDSQVG